MPDSSPALSLPYIQPSQAQKHVTHNEALRILDAVTQLSVQSGTLTQAPAVPVSGDRYLVGLGATGDWAGQDRKVAIHDGTDWYYFQPSEGWRADVIPTGAQLRFNGTSWVDTFPDLQNVPLVGIAATADSVNRLSISSPATLLNNAGAGHQLKINKATGPDTASLLFQNGFSGRAEMGLVGSDEFSIKVSSDGASYHEALSVDAGSGALRTPSGQTYFDDVTLADDTVFSFDIPWSDPSRILMWLALDLTGHSFLFSVTGPLSGASNFTPMFVNPVGVLNFLTGSLSGNTGLDGMINLSIDTGGAAPRMYLENRLGTSQTFTMATLGR
jgi:hypothetical protein